MGDSLSYLDNLLASIHASDESGYFLIRFPEWKIINRNESDDMFTGKFLNPERKS